MSCGCRIIPYLLPCAFISERSFGTLGCHLFGWPWCFRLATITFLVYDLRIQHYMICSVNSLNCIFLLLGSLKHLKVFPPISKFEEIDITKALTSRGRLHYPKIAKKSRLDEFLTRRTHLKLLEERKFAQSVCSFSIVCYIIFLCSRKYLKIDVFVIHNFNILQSCFNIQ